MQTVSWRHIPLIGLAAPILAACLGAATPTPAPQPDLHGVVIVKEGGDERLGHRPGGR